MGNVPSAFRGRGAPSRLRERLARGSERPVVAHAETVRVHDNLVGFTRSTVKLQPRPASVFESGNKNVAVYIRDAQVRTSASVVDRNLLAHTATQAEHSKNQKEPAHIAS